MTQYKKLNTKLSNSQLNKLISVTENVTEVTLSLSSKEFGDFNDDTNFPYELWLTNTQR